MDEHLAYAHGLSRHLNPRVPEDIAFAESRIRRETIAAEDITARHGGDQHHVVDSQAMGRVEFRSHHSYLADWRTR
jgi:urease subunit alpha